MELDLGLMLILVEYYSISPYRIGVVIEYYMIAIIQKLHIGGSREVVYITE